MEQLGRAEIHLQLVRDNYSGVMSAAHDKHLYDDDLFYKKGESFMLREY